MTPKESILADFIRRAAPVAIAFSGGVDSAVLAKAAFLFSPRNLPAPIAILAKSSTSTEEDVLTARRVASEIGIRFLELESSEMADPVFLQNGPERCYHCKRIRFRLMAETLARLTATGDAPRRLLEGSNADDALDYRPGSRAGAELGVGHPLADAGLTKAEIRELAEKWGLSVAHRPSTPCLVTRLAYGLAPTEERLRRIESAEAILATEGFAVCRVRLDSPTDARIEVAAGQVSRLAGSVLCQSIFERLRLLGFESISIDLEGFVSGKMNRGIK